jgi:hypothetical protein
MVTITSTIQQLHQQLWGLSFLPLLTLFLLLLPIFIYWYFTYYLPSQQEFIDLNIVPWQDRPNNNTTIKKPHRYQLGPAEHGMFLADQRQGHARVIFEIKLKGPQHATPEALKKALELAQIKYPPLRCRIQKLKHSNSLYFEEDLSLKLNVKWLPRDEITSGMEFFKKRSREQWKSIVEEYKIPYHVIWVFTSNNGQYQHLIFELLHSVFDGSNLGHFVHDILTWTFEHSSNNKPPTSLTSPPFPTCMENALVQINPNKLQSIGKGLINAMGYLFSFPIFSAIKKVMPHEYNQPVETNIFHENLTKEETQQLLTICRKEGITITSMILSIYLHAVGKVIVTNQSDNHNKLHLCGLVAADVRNIVKTDKELLLLKPDLSSMHITALFHKTSSIDKNNLTSSNKKLPFTSIVEQAKEIRNNLNQQSNNGITVSAGYLTGLALVYLPLEYTPSVSLFITSWGAKNPIQEQYGEETWVEHAAIYHPFPYGPQPNLSCYTVAGKLYLSLMGQDPIFSKEIISKISSLGREMVGEVLKQ